MTGRVFGASLKPAWSVEQIESFLDRTKGDILVYIINHDKDLNEQGEPAETHTHIYLEYSTPRKITTIANLLGVENNFIELIRNKKGYLRYLTHKDDEVKYQYDDSEVYTNGELSYTTVVLGNSLTDKDIATYLAQGRGVELLGLVSASKLRTIQSFLHFDSNNAVLAEIKALNKKLDSINDFIDRVETVALTFTNGFSYSVEQLTSGMKSIADEMAKLRLLTANRRTR